MLSAFGAAPAHDPATTDLKPARRRLEKNLRGHGLEIGALHNPMPIGAERATVRYVDVMSLEEQRRHYPELAGYSLVSPGHRRGRRRSAHAR